MISASCFSLSDIVRRSCSKTVAVINAERVIRRARAAKIISRPEIAAFCECDSKPGRDITESVLACIPIADQAQASENRLLEANEETAPVAVGALCTDQLIRPARHARRAVSLEFLAGYRI